MSGLNGHRYSTICNPEQSAAKRTSGLTRLFIIIDSHTKLLTNQLGTTVDRTTLTDPTLNARAAAALCQWSMAAGRSCYRPWGA